MSTPPNKEQLLATLEMDCVNVLKITRKMIKPLTDPGNSDLLLVRLTNRLKTTCSSVDAAFGPPKAARAASAKGEKSPDKGG